MKILEVKNLTKEIGPRTILQDVSFEINEGDILAFIGSNGAGKTTTIKCILGLQKATSGTILINGFNLENDFINAIKKVGCLVENPDVYTYLSGYENLKIQASYYDNVSKSDIDALVKLVGLESKIHDKVKRYSLGMKERLGIALSLINNPNLLILDEPTNGLDPKGIKDLRELLLSLKEKGIGILISSHNLSELESICNKVCIISKGQVIENKSIEEIKKINENKYLIKIDNFKKLTKTFKNKINIINDNYFEIFLEEKEIPKLINDLINLKVKVFEIKKELTTLENVFLNQAGVKNA